VFGRSYGETFCIIKNEDEEIISVAELEECIIERGDDKWCVSRHTIEDTFCVGHGKSTWDYILGEFS